MTRDIDSSELYSLMYRLPEGKAFTFDIQDISRAILRLLNFTGLDMMGGLRRGDIAEFMATYSKNLGLRITHDEMNRRVTFYKPAQKIVNIYGDPLMSVFDSEKYGVVAIDLTLDGAGDKHD